jgi:hypothetical protein
VPDPIKPFAGDKVRDIRNRRSSSFRLVPGRPAPEAGCADPDPTFPQLSIAPLTHPTEILRRIRTQAISPALLALLDIMSMPILLIEDKYVGVQFRSQNLKKGLGAFGIVRQTKALKCLSGLMRTVSPNRSRGRNWPVVRGVGGQ